MQGYGKDLAYIHDAGHRDYCLSAAPGLIGILKKHGITEGLVLDLGCGSGRLARELNRAGYRVLGIDQSPEMIRLARRIAPGSRFRVASLLSAELPACDAIASIGECLNYCFDETNSRRALGGMFRRAYGALRPGGVLVFDFAGPERHPGGEPRRYWSAGADWAVMSETAGGRGRSTLCRRIVAFRRAGKLYRRSEEVHYLRLYSPPVIKKDLERCGFRVRAIESYGSFRLPPGLSGVVAVKP